MDDSITLKGIKEGLLVTVKPDGRWSDLSTRLVAMIDAQQSFFQGSQVALSLGPRQVRRGDLDALIKQLSQRGTLLRAVLSDNEATITAARKLGVRTALHVSELATVEVDPLPPKPPPTDPEEHGTTGVLIKHTVRNGRMVQSDGHVVVLGDVNAGAVIIAVGDVIVWGSCRGIVHAGVQGDEDAVVCALKLAPTQLRIAGHITISPDDRRSKPRPEKAIVRNGRIEAIAWE